MGMKVLILAIILGGVVLSYGSNDFSTLYKEHAALSDLCDRYRRAYQVEFEMRGIDYDKRTCLELIRDERGDFSAAVDLTKPKDPEPSDFENEVFD